MTPVIVLSDGYVANSSEPWLLPDVSELPDISIPYQTVPNGPNGTYLPYLRDPTTLARPWAIPGTPGLEHRLGGLEKADITGAVSYDAVNHERMTILREDKIAGIANDIPPVEVVGADDAELLVLGWGSTYGALRAGVNNAVAEGWPVAHAHLRYINPLPSNLGDVLAAHRLVLVPELNRGQLSRVVRAEYLIDAISYSKVQGQPFKARELIDKVHELLEGKDEA
jgi:2-oxoglutarate ferredoxin oxidoreductase subunit alpha